MSRPVPRFLWALLALLAAPMPAFSEAEHLHVTRRGDTLIGISKELLRNPHQWPALQKLNRIADPFRILPGTRLRIPVAMMRQEPASLHVTAASGDVRVNDRKLSAGDSIAQGAEVVTGDQGFATIQLIDGSRLVLQPSSRLKVEESQRYRGTALPSTRLRLEEGRVESVVTRTLAPRPQYRIETPTAAIGVRGTRFRVGADSAGQGSRTEVTDGSVAMQGARGGTTAVPAGFGAVATADGAVSAPAALLPPPALTGVPDLQERITIRFSVPPVADALAYRFQVGAGSDMREVRAEVVSATPEAKFAGLEDGRYTLRVRAIDAAGLEGRDADRGFALKARPEPPFAVSPLTGEKFVAESVQMVWTSNPDAARYRIQMAQDERFEQPLADIDGVEGTTIMPAAKLPPGGYFWRARSLRTNGDAGPWGDAQRFVLKPRPRDPEPPKLNDRELSFAWPGEPGQTYLFQFARDEQFRDIVAERELTDATTTIARPVPDTYFMRVRATDPDGFVGPFTRPQRIDVPHPPPPLWLPLMLLLPLV